MALKRYDSNTVIGPVGVSDTSGIRRSGALLSAGLAESGRILGTYAEEKLSAQRALEAQDAAAKTEMRRDPVTGQLIMPDISDTFTVYGQEYRKAIVNKYAITAEGDIRSHVADLAAKNLYDAKAFKTVADAYLDETVRGAHPAVQASLLERGTARIGEYNAQIVNARARRDYADAVQKEENELQRLYSEAASYDPDSEQYGKARQTFINFATNSVAMSGRPGELQKVVRQFDIKTVELRLNDMISKTEDPLERDRMIEAFANGKLFSNTGLATPTTEERAAIVNVAKIRSTLIDNRIAEEKRLLLKDAYAEELELTIKNMDPEIRAMMAQNYGGEQNIQRLVEIAKDDPRAALSFLSAHETEMKRKKLEGESLAGDRLAVTAMMRYIGTLPEKEQNILLPPDMRQLLNGLSAREQRGVLGSIISYGGQMVKNIEADTLADLQIRFLAPHFPGIEEQYKAMIEAQPGIGRASIAALVLREAGLDKAETEAIGRRIRDEAPLRAALSTGGVADNSKKNQDLLGPILERIHRDSHAMNAGGPNASIPPFDYMGSLVTRIGHTNGVLPTETLNMVRDLAYSSNEEDQVRAMDFYQRMKREPRGQLALMALDSDLQARFVRAEMLNFNAQARADFDKPLTAVLENFQITGESDPTKARQAALKIVNDAFEDSDGESHFLKVLYDSARQFAGVGVNNKQAWSTDPLPSEFLSKVRDVFLLQKVGDPGNKREIQRAVERATKIVMDRDAYGYSILAPSARVDSRAFVIGAPEHLLKDSDGKADWAYAPMEQYVNDNAAQNAGGKISYGVGINNRNHRVYFTHTGPNPYQPTFLVRDHEGGPIVDKTTGKPMVIDMTVPLMLRRYEQEQKKQAKLDAEKEFATKNSDARGKVTAIYDAEMRAEWQRMQERAYMTFTGFRGFVQAMGYHIENDLPVEFDKLDKAIEEGRSDMIDALTDRVIPLRDKIKGDVKSALNWYAGRIRLFDTNLSGAMEQFKLPPTHPMWAELAEKLDVRDEAMKMITSANDQMRQAYDHYMQTLRDLPENAREAATKEFQEKRNRLYSTVGRFAHQWELPPTHPAWGKLARDYRAFMDSYKIPETDPFWSEVGKGIADFTEARKRDFEREEKKRRFFRKTLNTEPPSGN